VIDQSPSDQGPSPQSSPSAPEGEPDELFLDDLSATRRFMSFLLSRGVEVPKLISEELGELSSKFVDAIESYEAKVRESVDAEQKWCPGRS
jgi:hypothetical protein